MKKPRVVDVASSRHQPTKAELEEDVSLDPGDLSVDEAVEALLEPVELREKPVRRRRRRK